MQTLKPTRTNKPQRPPLQEYIRGRAKLEDLVSKDKLIKHDPSRTNRRALLASINSINKNSFSDKSKRQAKEKIAQTSSDNHGHSHFLSYSSSATSRRKSGKKGDQTPSESLKMSTTCGSLRSERSAQGDMTESNVKTLGSLSTRSSVIRDRVLNDKEKEIQTLTAEIENLKQMSNVGREQELVSLLQKLLEELPSSESQFLEPSDNFDTLVERLCNAMRVVRESHEKFSLINAEKEEKLAQVRVDNDELQKRVETLRSDLQRMSEVNELHSQQVVSFQAQNERLRADLESTRRMRTAGIEMCAALQLFIQDKFRNDIHKLQDFEKTLSERVAQLEQELEKLQSACLRHIHWLERFPCEQIEDLKEELQVTEIEKMRQMCGVTALYNQQEKRIDELCKSNEQLLEEAKHHETLLMTLSNENRSLKNLNQYLEQKNEALKEVCQKKIESLSSPLKQQTLATLNKKSLDAEMAYTEELMKQTNDTIRVTRRSNDH